MSAPVYQPKLEPTYFPGFYVVCFVSIVIIIIKNLESNSLPTSKSFQSNPTKFPHPRLHIAVNPKAEPKKGTIKISPNKTLQSFINVAVSPKIHAPVTAAIIPFNHNPCYTA